MSILLLINLRSIQTCTRVRVQHINIEMIINHRPRYIVRVCARMLLHSTDYFSIKWCTLYTLLLKRAAERRNNIRNFRRDLYYIQCVYVVTVDFGPVYRISILMCIFYSFFFLEYFIVVYAERTHAAHKMLLSLFLFFHLVHSLLLCDTHTHTHADKLQRTAYILMYIGLIYISVHCTNCTYVLNTHMRLESIGGR